MASRSPSRLSRSSTGSTKSFISRVFTLSKRDKRDTEKTVESTGKGPLGLTTLYAPSPDEFGQPHVADIIFVHGLNGGSHSTWSRGNNAEHFWPRQWLPKDGAFENSRIHTFGYPSGITRESVLNIRDIARSLLAAIKDSPLMRGERQAPLIMVAHSMGGLVVKMAYILGHHEQEFKPVVDRVCSIFFLATPHQGASIAEVLSRLTAAIGVRPFVEDLFPQSRLIQAVSEDFPRLCGHLQLFSFYETRPMTVGIKNALIVEKSSAVMNLANERRTFLDADHRNVAMYSTPEDPSYVSVKNALATVISSQKDSGPPLIQAPVQEDHDALGRFLGVSDAPAPEDDIIIHESIKLPGSCEWFLGKADYQSWKSPTDSTFLWIRGRPGAGKSVLSSHVVGDLRSQSLDCCFFFFQERDIVKSATSSCLRFLAWQMAMLHPSVLGKLKSIMSGWRDGPIDKISPDSLWQRIFLSGILKVKLDRPQFWVIDAMDECQEPTDMTVFLNRVQEYWPLSVLVTSRDAVLEHPRKGANLKTVTRSYTISEQDSLQDISLLLEANLSSLSCHASTKWSSPEEMASQILKRSEGCFLWASIICSELGQVTSEQEVTKVMESTPSDMDAVYRGILVKMETARFGKTAAKAFIAWTGYAFRPLSVAEMQKAIEVDIDDKIGDVQRAISRCCGNLVYVDQHGRVQLVHATAREFFTREGLESEFVLTKADGHRRLALVCLKFLLQVSQKPVDRARGLGPESNSRLGDNWSLSPRPPPSPPGAGLFMDYSSKFLFQHLNYAPSNDDELLAMLSNFLGSGNLLCWIEFNAASGDLNTIYQAGKTIKAILSRRAQQVPPVEPGQTQNKFASLNKWGDDLIYLVTRFSGQLRDSPRAIYHLIPPFCPPDSAIRQQFTNPAQGLNVHGISSSNWDDCLTTITYEKTHIDKVGNKPNVVAAGPGYFAVGMWSSLGQIYIYDDAIFQKVYEFRHQGIVRHLAFAQSGRYLASAGVSAVKSGGYETVRVWSLADGSELFSLKFLSRCLDLGFAEEDSILRMATKEGEVMEWDAKSGVLVHDEPATWDVHLPKAMQGRVPMLGKLGCGNLLALFYKGFDIVFWDCTSNRIHDIYERDTGSTRIFGTHQLADGRATVRVAAFSHAHDTNLFAAYYSDGDLVVYDLEKGKPLAVAEGANTSFLASSHDGRILAGVDSIGNLALFDFKTLRPLYRVQFDSVYTTPRGIAFTSDGLRFVEIGGNQCRVWEPTALLSADSIYTSDKMPVSTVTHEITHLAKPGKDSEIRAIACCHESSVVFCAMEDGSVFAYDISGPEPEKQLLFAHGKHADASLLYFDALGSILACGDRDGRFTARKITRRRHTGNGPRHRRGWEVDPPLIDVRAANEGTAGGLKQILVSSRHGRFLAVTESHDTLWPMPKQSEGGWINQLEAAIVPYHKRTGFPWTTRPGCESELLLRIGPTRESLRVYDWVTLTLVREVSLLLDYELVRLGRIVTNTWHHPHYLAVCTEPPSRQRRFLTWVGQLSPLNSILLWDYDSIESDPQSLAPRGSLDTLPCRVEYLIGSFGSRLVLYTADHWIASVELSPPGSAGALVEGSFVRHFFLPNDWIVTSGVYGLLFGVGGGGEIIVARRGELAVIKRGLEVTEDGGTFDPRRVSTAAR